MILVRPCKVIAVLALVHAVLLPLLHAESPRIWSRGFNWTAAHDRPGIGLYYLNQDDSDFYGAFSCENTSGKRETAQKIVIEGVESEHGLFWPSVRYEARKDVTAPWESLGKSSAPGRPKKLTIEAEATDVDLWVSLQIFKPLIGKYESGRIVLNDGHTSEFQLKHLAPPDT
jgi:hypothetical protein